VVAAELLRWCADSGRNVVLATSASEKDLEALRQVVHADDAITASTTVADAERSKPDTDILEAALDRVGGTAAESVFVGDAVWDMMAARRLDMRCIGLECGGITEAELLQSGADEVWRDPADLLSNIEKSALAPTDRR
jgi:phosphoglycolate phosphatase-like HAD superfamily hydrolase